MLWYEGGLYYSLTIVLTQCYAWAYWLTHKLCPNTLGSIVELNFANIMTHRQIDTQTVTNFESNLVKAASYHPVEFEIDCKTGLCV